MHLGDIAVATAGRHARCNCSFVIPGTNTNMSFSIFLYVQISSTWCGYVETSRRYIAPAVSGARSFSLAHIKETKGIQSDYLWLHSNPLLYTANCLILCRTDWRPDQLEQHTHEPMTVKTIDKKTRPSLLPSKKNTMRRPPNSDLLRL